jgi:hypothetical protein
MCGGGEGWTELAHVTGNYDRRRVHSVEPEVEAEELRVEILRTNGAESARVYEVRVY